MFFSSNFNLVLKEANETLKISDEPNKHEHETLPIYQVINYNALIE